MTAPPVRHVSLRRGVYADSVRLMQVSRDVGAREGVTAVLVAMPLIRIARFASRPMMSGKTNVAPNMATTCCAPMPTVSGHDSRSSGATASPSGGVFPSP